LADRITLDSLKSQLLQAKEYQDSAFVKCNKMELEFKKLQQIMQQKEVVQAKKIKHWKRKLIWQKIKMPIGVVATYFLTKKI
jgi:hypothetical protein